MDVGDEMMLHQDVFLYPNAQDEPAPVPRRTLDQRRDAPTRDRTHGHVDEDRDEYAGDGGNEEEGDAVEYECGGEESQPPPQFSSHQDFTIFEPPPYYGSYQYSTQSDAYFSTFEDTPGFWNTGGGDMPGPSKQR
ncbi:unnamed protein product [Cuscuta epithymum]|uniref:Uncharacterized protein n=1 Tax=Cuscuta epithymum TaxID=186058 RepID=A0AAV0FQR7_9ASTE|nr:unnamed protein product [Cuscuta epithymum]